MIKIHLAQFAFNPAYYDPPNDYLEEPSPYSEPSSALGNLRHEEIIQSFLLDAKSNYLEHIRTKISHIASWSSQRGANVLVYPEYSVPYQSLPELAELSRKYSMSIVAGTHRVKVSESSKKVYESVGLVEKFIIPGAAISPIFLPDGSAKAAIKLRKSKWEPNLVTPSIYPNVVSVDYNGNSINFAVIPCIDCLHPDIVGKVFDPSAPTIQLLLCPSLSPATEPFKSIGTIAALDEVVFAYVNTALYGGTFFNLPAHWQSYLQGNSTNANNLPSGTEAILELEVDQSMFFVKSGSIKTAPVCHHPTMYPIIFEKSSSWLQDFEQVSSDVLELLEASDINSAIEWLDGYLAEQAQNIPLSVRQNITYVRHSVLPLFDGQVDTVKRLIETVNINELESTASLFGKHISQALRILGKFIIDPNNKSIDTALECIRALKTHQAKFPVHPVDVESKHAPLQKIPQRTAFAGDADLIESFQNRGNDLDAMRDTFTRSDIRVILITGAMGIGKSSFINAFFRKILADWEIIRIKVATDTRFPRLLADIGYNIGLPLDVDSLSYSSNRVFEQMVLKVLREFFRHSKTVLVIDDLHQLLIQRNAKDFKQLKLFIDKALSVEPFTGGRIVLLSSQWLPDSWIRQKGIIHHGLRRVADKYIRRIIEYHMHKLKTFSNEDVPDLPQAVLDLVNGHPLSAKLLVEATSDQSLTDFTSATEFEKVSGYIAKELLKFIRVLPNDESLLIKFSVFRVPVLLNGLLAVSDFEGYRDRMLDLANRCVLSYDGARLEMHEAVRRHYLGKIASKDDLERYHTSAVMYYQKLYQSDGATSQKDPTILGELAYHLSQAGKIVELQDIRSLVISEIKPSARKIYREYHDYQRALQLYRLIHEVVPDDVEVTAYIGRCHARLQQWGDSDRAFEDAIELANKRSVPFWWIYRDWGHIRARYGYYAIALEHFDRASDIIPSDPSIQSSIAFMYWRQGMYDEAQALFEEALSLNAMHEYTLKYYSKFLNTIGEMEYAEMLRNRLYDIEHNILGAEPIEYDTEDDFDE